MELKRILKGVLSSNPDDNAVRELIFICKKIALVYLRKKAHQGQLYNHISALRLEDLALDCIADLFNRDNKGALVQIKLYFEGLSLEHSSEEESLTHLRRLVFSRINQSIFRIYHETDPGLSKILRNMKLAIHSLQNFIVTERFGEQCLVPVMCDTLEHLPPFEQSELECLLRQRLTNRDPVPAMLAKFSLFLREQNDHCRIVPCIFLAQIFRSVYDLPFLTMDEAQTHPDIDTPDDVVGILHSVCRAVKEENSSHYTQRKKVSSTVYESYFDVIFENLFQRLLNHNGENFSFFDRLKCRLPGLTKEEYKKYHKSKLEYLARLTFKRTVAELKKDLC